ncbi:MAG: DUF2948 family protein [Pseudomonadota bacterium]
MAPLRLIALEPDDMPVLSAHVQDAVLKVSDLRYMPRERRFVLALNRFAWETGGRSERSGLFRPKTTTYERRRSVLHFDQVSAVRQKNIRLAAPDAVLNLLAVVHTPGDGPLETIELVFSGGGAIRLDVDVIEAQLADMGGAWETASKPAHDDDVSDETNAGLAKDDG